MSDQRAAVRIMGGVQKNALAADEDRQSMRNFSFESSDFPATPVDPAKATGALPCHPKTMPRTAADYSGLLLELARAQRGFLFYKETDARRGPLADRAFRAVESELERAGSIEFTLTPDARGFEIPGQSHPLIATGAIAEFSTALGAQGISQLRFDAGLTPTALTGLFNLLSQRDENASKDAGRFARNLAARDSRGILINEGHGVPEEPPKRLEETSPRSESDLTRFPAPNNAEKIDKKDPIPSQSADVPATPSLEEAPLLASVSDSRGARLRARLVDLDSTSDDAEYLDRAGDIVTWAEELFRNEMTDECYRAMLVLADHAVGSGGRSLAQARAAAAGFRSLAQAGRLEDLIDRAMDSGIPGVRAAQLLLQLGEDAMPAILRRLAVESEAESEGAVPLRALVVTQGERALPAIARALESHDDDEAREGIRLAGALQNPDLLPALKRTLRSAELSRRIETIRALSFMPGDDSREVLTAALESDLEEIASAASQALARTDGVSAVPALLDVLEASARTHRTKLACALVDVLGKLGDDRAVPRLCAILERRPVLKRAHWHALQLSAADALAVLPTKTARQCLERAARDGAASVRARAKSIIAAAS